MRIDVSGVYCVPEKMAALIGAKAERFGTPSPYITGIATHSGEVRPGDLFVALRGEHTDGSVYFGEALRHGAVALAGIHGRAPEDGSFYYMAVADTENALLRAAAQHRERYGSRVIAITGSAGKTTVKEAVSAILGDVPHSTGNYNSTVGMPLSVLEMPPAPFWVCELGINHIGEMARMAGALSPDIALVTNVGTAHIGLFGDHATLLREKLAIADALGEQGTLLLPLVLKESIFQAPLCHLLSFGDEREADFCAENITMGQKGVTCDLRGHGRVITNLTWPIAGRIGISVIAAVGAVGILAECTDVQIRHGLERAARKAPRMPRYQVTGRLFLDDSYNASPESVVAALEALAYLAQGRPRVAVLGDMLELGTHTLSLHALVGRAAAKAELSYLITYGEDAVQIARIACENGLPVSRVRHFNAADRDALCAHLCATLPPDAVVLFKASHRMGLDEIVKRVGESL